MGTANGLKAVGVGVFLFALGFGSGFPLLFRLGYALVALAVLGLAWTVANLIGLEFVRQTRETRAEVGQTFEETFSLRNRLLLPKLWLECRDHSTLQGHTASRAFDFGPRQRRTWSARTVCRRRGRFLLGPITITTGDPFGLFRMRRRWSQRRELIVYPETVGLDRLRIPHGPLVGGNIVLGRSNDPTPNSLGVREYQSGDALHRIHWPSTARIGALMVKEFEPDPYCDVWLVLDAAAHVQRGNGDESTEEYGVKITASLAKHFLQRHRAVGLVADGGDRLVLPADRGYRQLTRILEALAVLRAGGRRRIDEVLAAETARFRRGSTIFVITPCPIEDWASVLRQGTGILPAIAVLINAASFDESTPDVRPKGDGAGAEVQIGGDAGDGGQSEARVAREEALLPSFQVNRGDDIAKALAVPAGSA